MDVIITAFIIIHFALCIASRALIAAISILKVKWIVRLSTQDLIQCLSVPGAMESVKSPGKRKRPTLKDWIQEAEPYTMPAETLKPATS